MNITNDFHAHPKFKRLARRKNNFALMCQHAVDFAEKNGRCDIIETGSAWDKDNWEGQGQSTLIWDWLIMKYAEQTHDAKITAISIDIRPEGTKIAQEQSKNVSCVTGESVMTLSTLGELKLKDCGLLYLDSFDWNEQLNFPSACHHLCELATVYAKLPDGCLIVVDDRHGDEKGKHWMVEFFMEGYLKTKTLFKNHQIGWIKGKKIEADIEAER